MRPPEYDGLKKGADLVDDKADVGRLLSDQIDHGQYQDDREHARSADRCSRQIAGYARRHRKACQYESDD
jgi:hypothetical protein